MWLDKKEKNEDPGFEARKSKMKVHVTVEGTEEERAQVRDVIKFFQEEGTLGAFVDDTAHHMMENGYPEDLGEELRFEEGNIYERIIK